MYLSKFSTKTHDELERPLNFADVNKSLWNDKCDYIDPDKCKDFNPNGFNLIILQLNIRSLFSNITELKQLLHTQNQKRSCVDIILLCETFLSKNTEKLVNLPDYKIICNNRSTSKGDGTAILLQN